MFSIAKALSDTSGLMASGHSSRAAAEKAAKADHRYKVLELKRPLQKGDHANYRTEVIASNAGVFTK